MKTFQCRYLIRRKRYIAYRKILKEYYNKVSGKRKIQKVSYGSIIKKEIAYLPEMVFNQYGRRKPEQYTPNNMPNFLPPIYEFENIIKSICL